MFRHLLCLIVALACGGPALADPGYYLLTPYGQAGQWTLDARYWTVKAPGEAATLWPELGLRYGVDSRWTTELLASFIGDSLRHQRLSSLNWQNAYLLTHGERAFDLAVHAQLIRENGEATSLEIGPLLQTDIGATQFNANLVFEHSWPSSDGTQLKYQWQLLHRLQPGLRLGLQGFGELGRWDHWAPRDQQSHRAGPALFGVLPIGSGTSLLCQAAILWGSTYARHGDMFSLRAQLAF